MLGLSPEERADVVTSALMKGTRVGMGLALSYWKNRNPVGATFRALLLILLSLVEVDTAFQVCNCELVDFSSFVNVLSLTILRYSRN